MSTTVSLQASWDDAYPDPDVLEQVQRAIEEYVTVDVTLDWDELRAIRSTRDLTFYISRDYVGALESTLKDLWGWNATAVGRFDIVPFPLFVDFVEMGDASQVWHNRWQLYSAERALNTWQRLLPTSQAEIEHLAQASSDDETSAAGWSERASAYCLLSLVRIAQASIEQRLPARLYW